MLNTPTSVDSLPRLRRFNPSQTQTSPFAYLGHDEGNRELKSQEGNNSKENTKNKEETTANRSVGTPPSPTKESAKEKEDERPEERREAKQVEVKQLRTSEVLSQPVSEIQGTAGSQVKPDSQDRRDLVEVTVSGTKPPDSQRQEVTGEGEAGAGAETYGGDQKMCCGFFFQVKSYVLQDKMLVHY